MAVAPFHGGRGEGGQEVRPGGGIDEGALGQGVGHPVHAQVGELAGSEGPHFGLRRQEDGADEAGQEAGRFQGAGIQGLGEHHRGAVPGLRQQAAVEGGFDVKHGTPRALARRVYQGAAARFST